jgi:branched-subunit amino acid aminotransferase/4-amino-4-deoxychorismate lyase
MRGRVLARAGALGIDVLECQIERPVLEGVQTLFLTNSLIGLRPVSALDGRALQADEPRVEALRS